jgi:hypothetical protein
MAAGANKPRRSVSGGTGSRPLFVPSIRSCHGDAGQLPLSAGVVHVRDAQEPYGQIQCASTAVMEATHRRCPTPWTGCPTAVPRGLWSQPPTVKHQGHVEPPHPTDDLTLPSAFASKTAASAAPGRALTGVKGGAGAVVVDGRLRGVHLDRQACGSGRLKGQLRHLVRCPCTQVDSQEFSSRDIYMDDRRRARPRTAHAVEKRPHKRAARRSPKSASFAMYRSALAKSALIRMFPSGVQKTQDTLRFAQLIPQASSPPAGRSRAQPSAAAACQAHRGLARLRTRCEVAMHDVLLVQVLQPPNHIQRQKQQQRLQRRPEKERGRVSMTCRLCPLGRAGRHGSGSGKGGTPAWVSGWVASVDLSVRIQPKQRASSPGLWCHQVRAACGCPAPIEASPPHRTPVKQGERHIL